MKRTLVVALSIVLLGAAAANAGHDDDARCGNGAFDNLEVVGLLVRRDPPARSLS